MQVYVALCNNETLSLDKSPWTKEYKIITNFNKHRSISIQITLKIKNKKIISKSVQPSNASESYYFENKYVFNIFFKLFR